MLLPGVCDSKTNTSCITAQVEEVFRQDDGRLWGANVMFLRNGEPVTTLYIGMPLDVHTSDNNNNNNNLITPCC